MDGQFGVAVKAVVRKGDVFLVLTRSETDTYKPCEFDLPGGKINYGEKLEDALRREVKEESNLEIEILKPLHAWSVLQSERHLVGVTYLADYVSGEVQLSFEHSAYTWKTLEEIMDGNFPQWIKKDVLLV